MPNYQNGKIYTLRSHQTDDVYIGSTTLSLAVRKAGHKLHYKQYLNGKYRFTTSFNIIKFDDCYIELMENYQCNSKNELERREGQLIREMDCVNKFVAGRTKKEWRDENKEVLAERAKEYYEANKEVIAEREKKYREANKEKIKEYREANKEKIKEYMKNYYETNKEKSKEKSKEYREANKEKIKEYREANKEVIAEREKKYREANKEKLREKHTCECGGKYTLKHKSTHAKSKKHQEYMNANV